MVLNHIILAILWISYCIIHSVLADLRIKKRIQRKLGKKAKYFRLYYTLFAFVSLVGLFYYQINLKTIVLYKPSLIVFVLALIVTLFGLAIMAICIKKYFINISGLLSLVEEKPSNKLIISDIHQYVRHPLYLGTFIFIWGLFLLLPCLSLLIANTIITTYTLIGIRLEEKKLVAEFGNSYIRYQESVPRIVPFLKIKRKVQA